MSKFLAGLSGGSGIAAAGAVTAVVVAGAAWYQFDTQPPPEPLPAVAVAPPAETAPQTAPPAPQVQEDATTEVEPAPTPIPVEPAEEASTNVPPAFDEVRREADGMTVIAGRAAPDAQIQILLDGGEIATARADAAGKFATLALIAPDGKGHVLSLVQILGDVTLASLDEIILAPLTAPVVIAQVEEPVLQAPVVSVVPDAEPQTVTAEVAPVANQVAETESDTTEVKVAQSDATTEVTSEDEPVVAAADADGAASPVDVGEAPKTVDEDIVTAAVEPVEEDTVTAAADPSVASQTPAVSQAAPEPVVETAGPEATPDDAPVEVASVEPAPVQAPPAVALLKSTAEGVELLNPSAPEVMDNVVLDTISYSEIGDVQLSGRAQSDTRAVRVYLNNDAVVSLSVDEDGSWRGDIPNIDEGIYTLRVDEIAEDGNITSRVETPFKREAPEVLAAALAAQDGPIKAITVQKGATLWAIARERYGRGELFVRVFEANRDLIRDANLIYPGQVFDLPD